MNKTFFKIIVSAWVILVVLNFVVPKREFSVQENRYLKKFPEFSWGELLDGSFMQGVDSYLNDHFLSRDGWVSLKSSIEYGLGRRESNGVFIGKNTLIEDIDKPKQEFVAANIEGIKNLALKYDKKPYLMLIPSASEILSDKLPLFASGSFDQKKFSEETYSALDGSVIPIDIYNSLYERKDEYIYYKTDHHWTTDGAYAAYQKACEVMNIDAFPISEYKATNAANDFYGTLYSKSGYRQISPDTIKTYDSGNIEEFFVNDGKTEKSYTSIYFKEFLDQKDKYSYLLGTNQPMVTIKTSNTNGKRLVMLKDSYSHSLAPFFAQNYSEICLVDLRYINTDIDNIVDLESFDDIMLVYSMDMFIHQNSIAKLKSIK